MEKIPIFTFRSVEPGMEIVICPGHFVYSYSRRQDGIQFAADLFRLGGSHHGRVEVCYIIDRIDVSIGSSGSRNGYFSLQEH